MCGIAGFFDPLSPEAEARLRLGQMLELIRHRGPDGEGTFVSPELGLAMGMRRLSIIDLEGGRQPIWNEDETIGVVFNGEIYNYVELRQELLARGHRFRTECDTEVLVHLYEEAGPALVERLRGMFGFAIVDLRTRRLLLARDHFGQKPLYFATSPQGQLAFASELKCLLALPWVQADVRPEAFADYAAWLSLPPAETHFQAIRKLPAGHRLLLPLLPGGSPPEPERYFRYGLEQPPDLLTPEAAIEAVQQALTETTTAHIRADVPLGVLLSSGLDSRTVAAWAQDQLAGTMQTFTVGFAGPESELPEAERTAQEIGSRHHALEITPEHLLRFLPQVAWHLDEPVGDPAAFAVLMVCKMAREHVKVLLSGEGSDELFGGYEARYGGMLQTLARSDRFRTVSRLLPRPRFGAASGRWERFLERAGQTRAAETLALRREGFPGDPREPRGFSPAQRTRLGQRQEQIGLPRTQRDALSTLLALDVEWQLAESLLQKADKMSMAASIELRTPLLDTGVAAVAARIPSALKLPPGGPGKWVLRQALARKLHEPKARPKRGFPIPLEGWFRGPLREPLRESLFATHSPCLEYLEKPRLQAAWDDFQEGRWDGARLLYSLWLYNEWARQLRDSRLQQRPE